MAARRGRRRAARREGEAAPSGAGPPLPRPGRALYAAPRPPPLPNPHRAGPGARRGGQALPGSLLRVPPRLSPLPGQAQAGLGPGLAQVGARPGPGASGFDRDRFPSRGGGARAVLSPTPLPSALPRLTGLGSGRPSAPPPPLPALRTPSTRARPGQRGGSGRLPAPRPKRQPCGWAARTKATQIRTRGTKRRRGARPFLAPRLRKPSSQAQLRGAGGFPSCASRSAPLPFPTKPGPRGNYTPQRAPLRRRPSSQPGH